MRSTLYNIPCNQDMLKESQIPLAILTTPFAKIPKDEVWLHFVNLQYNCPVTFLSNKLGVRLVILRI